MEVPSMFNVTQDCSAACAIVQKTEVEAIWHASKYSEMQSSNLNHLDFNFTRCLLLPAGNAC